MEKMTKIFGETKAGKKIGVRPKPNTTLLEICFDSGGQLPKKLQGLWTEPQAKRAIEVYIDMDKQTKPKGKQKAEAE